jgi:hypothetical protein
MKKIKILCLVFFVAFFILGIFAHENLPAKINTDPPSMALLSLGLCVSGLLVEGFISFIEYYYDKINPFVNSRCLLFIGFGLLGLFFGSLIRNLILSNGARISMGLGPAAALGAGLIFGYLAIYFLREHGRGQK